MKENFIHKTKCRICASEDLINVLDLGEMPLANAFLEEGDLLKEEHKFPLSINITLSQISSTSLML